MWSARMLMKFFIFTSSSKRELSRCFNEDEEWNVRRVVSYPVINELDLPSFYMGGHADAFYIDQKY